MKCGVLMAGLLALSGQIYAWGFYGHRLINYHAVFLLPPEMMVLYKPNITYLSDHAVDPDKRRYAIDEEGARHYIDMDRYPQGVFSSFDVTWEMACRQFTEDTLKLHGIVPWWIQTTFWRLTEAFKENNVSKILKLSADIGHYIGDAHVPLHASSNHNGQYSNQRGIHGFWESRLPELLAEKEWDLWIGRAEYIRKPLPYIWKKVHESAHASDTVLLYERILNKRFPAEGKYAFENRNGILVKQYSEAYSREYDLLLDGMVERRLRESISTVASFWYTAWVNAGQPDCRKMAGTMLDDKTDEDIEQLNTRWKEGRIKGKSCD